MDQFHQPSSGLPEIGNLTGEAAPKLLRPSQVNSIRATQVRNEPEKSPISDLYRIVKGETQVLR